MESQSRIVSGLLCASGHATGYRRARITLERRSHCAAVPRARRSPHCGCGRDRKRRAFFSSPTRKAGGSFGYDYDGWHDDGLLHYTGDGQVGDQSPEDGGNHALLKAADQERSVRMFASEGRATTYVGEFVLANPPYYRADSLDRNGEPGPSWSFAWSRAARSSKARSRTPRPTRRRRWRCRSRPTPGPTRAAAPRSPPRPCARAAVVATRSPLVGLGVFLT